MLLPILSHLALRTLDIGKVYMSTGATYVLVLILSLLLLNEEINVSQLFNILLILLGVVMYNIS